jgi:hypothetical protein
VARWPPTELQAASAWSKSVTLVKMRKLVLVLVVNTGLKPVAAGAGRGKDFRAKPEMVGFSQCQQQQSSVGRQGQGHSERPTR